MAKRTIFCPKCISAMIIKKGTFKTKHNHQPVRRYLCKDCGKYFSSSTDKKTFKQHKPELNSSIFKLLCSGVTLRRTAKILGINKNTVAKKLKFLSGLAQEKHKAFLLKTHTGFVQFDQIETYEHTKLKPLSIAIAIRAKTGEILDMNVGALKGKGPLAALSKIKYGHREDTTHQACIKVLETIKNVAKEDIVICSDSKTTYPNMIKSVLPHAQIRRSLGRKNTELLWRLNHTAAKLRADLARMHRRTWSTTKARDWLQAHLYLYIAWNNGYEIV